MVTKYVLRKRAQRAYPRPNACERCGNTSSLQRHHPNLNDALSVVILCQACHVKEYVTHGSWGRGPRKEKVCVVCGKGFSDYSHSRVKTCGRECLTQLGRLNAFKRWGTGSLDLGRSETPSSRKSRNTLEG